MMEKFTVVGELLRVAGVPEVAEVVAVVRV
jgi:hypothetical protein